jgi:hypothetical protein
MTKYTFIYEVKITDVVAVPVKPKTMKLVFVASLLRSQS